MKKLFGVGILIFLLSFCYAEVSESESNVDEINKVEDISKSEGVKSKKYILTPNIGYEYYNASIFGRGVRIDTGVIGLDFMYLGTSGFTAYVDVGIVFGTSFYERLYPTENGHFNLKNGVPADYFPFKGWVGGISFGLFLGRSWDFEQKHVFSVAGGMQFAFASGFRSLIGLGVRLSYSYSITEKIGIMATTTGAISYNSQHHIHPDEPYRGAIGIGRVAVKLGPYFKI